MTKALSKRESKTAKTDAPDALAEEKIDVRRSWVGKWIGDHIFAAVSLLGLVFYGFALLSYSEFYGAFGLYPDEAGLDYTRALARTITAFCFWFLSLIAVLLIVVIPVLLVRWAGRVWHRRRPGKQTPTRTGGPRTGKPPSRLGPGVIATLKVDKGKSSKGITNITLAVIALIAVLLVFQGLAFNAPKQLVERVKRGEEIRQPSERDIVGYYREAIRNPFRIRVERVRVSPANPAAGLPAHLDTKRRYAYLGRSGDTIILYDGDMDRVGRTLRVPAALVALSDLAEEEDTDADLLWKILNFPR